MPQRSSDLVETYSARAIGAGVVGLVFLGLGTVMFIFRGDSGLPLAIVLFVIALSALGYAVFSLSQLRTVSAHKLDCPMCGRTNGFAEPPMQDVICSGCHRSIPIENGQILPLSQVSCNFCQESNFYSDHTKSLLCESCGREIAIARPDAFESHSAYGIQDDPRPHEVVLIAYSQQSEALLAELQSLLGANRNQVKAILGQLPYVLITNVPKAKADAVRSQLARVQAACEARPVV